MTEFFIEINGHKVADLAQLAISGQYSQVAVCLSCGTRFADRLELEGDPCPAVGIRHNHHLVGDDEEGLLYCRRCPLVAYDLADVSTEPTCPMPLDPIHPDQQ